MKLFVRALRAAEIAEKRRLARAKKETAKVDGSCASEQVAEMTREWKKGRWKSREQAVAVGLSKARKSCPPKKPAKSGAR